MQIVISIILLFVCVSFINAEPYTIDKIWGNANQIELGSKEVQLAYCDIKPDATIYDSKRNKHTIYTFTFPEVKQNTYLLNYCG